MKAFVTGSRAYGEPTEDSDVDLVVLIEDDFEQYWALSSLAELHGAAEAGEEYDGTWGNMRFGRLNLIVCQDLEEYETWRLSTEYLKARRPVTREFAVWHHRRRAAGLWCDTLERVALPCLSNTS